MQGVSVDGLPADYYFVLILFQGVCKVRRLPDMTGWKMWEHGIPDSRIIVVKQTGKDKYRNNMYLCECSCGKSFETTSTSIFNGRCKSCGCLKVETALKNMASFKKHGLAKTRPYQIWSNMKRRCYNHTDSEYKNYGGRGIKICDEWLEDFVSFYEWAQSSGYNDFLTIDRKDVDGDYCPENCRWVTMRVQCNNKTDNHNITYNGETHTLSQWSEILDVNYYTLRSRINILGWDAKRAFETPFNGRVYQPRKTKEIIRNAKDEVGV